MRQDTERSKALGTAWGECYKAAQEDAEAAQTEAQTEAEVAAGKALADLINEPVKS